MNINERLKNLEKEDKELNSKYKTTDFLCKVGIISGVAPGVLTILSAPLVSIPLISMAVGCVCNYSSNHINMSIKKNGVTKRINRLSNVVKNKVDISNEAQQNRVSKLNGLQKKENEKASKTASLNFASKLATAGMFAATIVGISMPGPLSFLAPAATAIKLYTDKKYTESLRESESIQAETESLRYEYSAAKNLRSRKANTKTNQKAQKQVKQQVKQPVKQNVNQQARPQVKQPNRKNEDIVDEYIRNIENNKKMSESEKQMLKKYISNYTKKK